MKNKETSKEVEAQQEAKTSYLSKLVANGDEEGAIAMANILFGPR